jgi:hypothetical protein
MLGARGAPALYLLIAAEFYLVLFTIAFASRREILRFDSSGLGSGNGSIAVSVDALCPTRVSVAT